MIWDQITKTWTQPLFRGPQASKSEVTARPQSVDFTASVGREYREERAVPYIPDNRGERSDSSLHLSS